MPHDLAPDRPATAALAPRSWRGAFWVVSIALAALHAWADRHSMNPDGVSYLDMADAYVRGDWAAAVNPFWSPLYPWVLGLGMRLLDPAAPWEFPVVHLVNLAVFVCALGAFEFLLREVRRASDAGAAGRPPDGAVGLPGRAWRPLGYTLFLWTSLEMVTLSVVAPDMLVAAVVYLAAGLLVRIRAGLTGRWAFALLGFALGLGYLAKASMFPVALVLLAVGWAAAGGPHRAWPRAALSLAVFLAVGAPLVVAVSAVKGRWTFGESGRVNYAWYANGVPRFAHWQGEGGGSGAPIHPTRRVLAEPALYEFDGPVGGTYPPWYDPSYWYEGVALRLDPKGQLTALAATGRRFLEMLTIGPQTGVDPRLVSRVRSGQAGLIVGLVALLLYAGTGPRAFLRAALERWVLLVPAVAAPAMYALVHVEPRYVAPFVALAWLGLFSAVRLPDRPESARLAGGVAVAVAAVMAVAIGVSSANALYEAARDLRKGDAAAARVQWRVAAALHRLGVRPGDRVASVGYSFGAYWARLARVRIVAEVPAEEADRLAAASEAVRRRVIGAFADAGATAVVADTHPGCGGPPGWQRLGDTGYYAYLLPREAAGPGRAVGPPDAAPSARARMGPP